MLVDEVGVYGWGGLVDLASVNAVSGVVALVHVDAAPFKAKMATGELGTSAPLGDGDR